MRNITLKQAAQWCGGTVALEYEQIAFHGVNFDTRLLRAGELFVAICGARDGHAYAQSAMEKGAAAVLASRPVDAPAIYVDDTVAAMQRIAKAWRETLRARVIGITGSVGKTTTRGMIASVLQTTFFTQTTLKNFNNDIGLPVSLLAVEDDCQAAVLEMGMNHRGELSALTAIAQPDIAVITNIGTMHIENLGSREGILHAKLEILEGLRPDGRAVFCGDDDLLRAEAKKYGALTFGLSEGCDVRGTAVNGTSFTVCGLGAHFPVSLKIAGEHNVYNALAAAAVGLLCGVTPENIQKGLAAYETTGMRQNVFTSDGITVIEDCYNAGPESMRAALKLLAGYEGRRIAVLGGMLELGDYAPQAHTEVGAFAAQTADLLFVYGENSEYYLRGAHDMTCAQGFPTHEALAQALQATLRSGDVLLVKGSRGMKMERVLALLNIGGTNHG